MEGNHARVIKHGGKRRRLIDGRSRLADRSGRFRKDRTESSTHHVRVFMLEV